MNHDASTPDGALQRFVDCFEQLSPTDVQRLGEFYSAEVRFKDPFNDVQGVPAVQRIFRDMFDTLEEPRFRVTERVVQGRQAFLTWDFVFRFRRFKRGEVQTIRGATHLVFDDSGRVTLHRDYWDAAEELYEKIPGIGGLMRWLKRRAHAGDA